MMMMTCVCVREREGGGGGVAQVSVKFGRIVVLLVLTQIEQKKQEKKECIIKNIMNLTRISVLRVYVYVHVLAYVGV
jgi:hypothetical protein